MPSYAHTEVVNATPTDVFALLADTDRAPEWNPRCIRIDKLSEGPPREGLEMRYHYKDGRRSGEMAGTITAFEPDRHLTMVFTDSMMAVSVDFVTADGSVPGTTKLTNTIDISTKGIGKLLTPLIKRSMPEQTLTTMANIKTISEG